MAITQPWGDNHTDHPDRVARGQMRRAGCTAAVARLELRRVHGLL